MNTPIADFVRKYADSDVLRLHMPGHKGAAFVGFESMDITEIRGADSLYEADGIIRKSEENASSLFGAHTFYSTEGSSLSIRAMLYLVAIWAKEQGRRPLIAAGRNAHKAFLSAAALIDFDILWLCPDGQQSYLSCNIDGEGLEQILAGSDEIPTAVYLTSPDYLGNTADIAEISRVCKKYGVLLLVDNAHGAYLKFLPESTHPIDLGADVCCDSAHKTLPVLTGGGYMHVSKNAPEMFKSRAKDALALFGSTSPSYLILQSLDMANKYISDGYREKLERFVDLISDARNKLTAHGYVFAGTKPLKITINTKSYGYLGYDFAATLEQFGIICEFADRDYCVLMLTPETGEDGVDRLTEVLMVIPRLPKIDEPIPRFQNAKKVMTAREAVFSRSEVIPAAESAGRILAVATVGCPPAVPIVVCGECIDETAVKCFEYYGVDKVSVVKE